MSTLPVHVPSGPGIIVHTQKPEPRRHSVSLSRRHSLMTERQSTLYGQRNSAVVSLDRLSYLNTALEALPGMTLMKHFTPIVRLRRSVWERRRLTRDRLEALGPTLAARKEKDAMQSLVKAVTEAAADLVPGYTIPLDPKALGELLEGKLEPVSFKSGSVLYYPQEPPEALFVYIVVDGGVTVTQYQPQSNRATLLGGERKQYFTSGKETLRLCGGGVLQGSLLSGPDLLGAPVPTADADANNSSSQNNPTNVNNDAVSISNVTTAIQRGLREASRAVGQPTLQAIRSDLLRSPIVFGAAEALGMSPFKSMSCIAAGKGEPNSSTDVYRIRALDVQRALQQLAAQSESPKRGGLAEFIVAARVKAIATYYYPTEVLLRQSWLLQDTPTATIRNLMSHLTPRTFMPGEVIACPHHSTRQLVFLRRGEISVVEPRTSTDKRGCLCKSGGGTSEGKELERIYPGSSFGELSVLFGEPRQFTLRAATVCDGWVLSHDSFSRTMRRDEALRHALVTKAAALRIKWLGEQRFTPGLAQHLRQSCEMFRPFNAYTLRLIQERIQPVVFSPGELVASTSQRCGGMVFIMRGKVTSISGADVTYTRGDVLGAGCLVAHRWPIGLSARTMVEGWRLSREDLEDALERMDRLHHYSGLYSSEAFLYMQQIYRNPVPEVESDAVGRVHMPVVPAAPGGVSYSLYGRQVSEIQLKAQCFLFQDYVKWEDISYATMGAGTALPDADSLARKYTVDTLRSSAKTLPETKKGKPASLAERLANRSVSGKTSQKKATSRGEETGTAATVPPLPPGGTATAKTGTLKNRKKKSNNTGACAFLVDPEYFSRPFMSRELQQTVPSRPATAPNRLANKDKDNEAIAMQSAARVREVARVPPRLQRFQKLLEERDRLLESEAQEEAEENRKRAKREGVAIQNYLSNAHYADGKASPKNPLYNDLAPIHLFLSSPKPRAEITMQEAISIGYVMQFPDTNHIEACVSLIDPDITVGVPAHRGRRRAMACTPNDRHTKNNFLFAAAVFSDTVVNTVDLQLEERRMKEQDRNNKANKLLTMLKANLEATANAPAADTDVSFEEGAPSQDGLTSLKIVVPGEEEVTRRSSPLDVGTVSTPVRLLSSAPSTPSPFRASPARGAQQQEEQFIQLLVRNPQKALQQLQQQFLPKTSPTGPRSTAQSTATPLSGNNRATSLWNTLRSAVREGDRTPTPAFTEEEHEEVLFTNTEDPLPPLQVAVPKDYWRTANYYCPSESPPHAMSRYFTLDDGILFVENYGALSEVGGSPSGNKNVVLPYRPSSPSGAEWASGMPPLSRRTSMWRAAVHRHSATGGDGEEEADFAITPNDFRMPDPSEAMTVVRRIQRDVAGLNEVAKDQARERVANERRRKLDEILSHPTEEETLATEEWRSAYHITVKDPLKPVLIPDALLPQAGPDYAAQELQAMEQQRSWGPPPRSGVEEWQEGLESRRGPYSARRVLATYGNSQLGLPVIPLSTPLADMPTEDHKGWVSEREELFQTYRQQVQSDPVSLPAI